MTPPQPLTIHTELRVTTENSIWLIRPHTYLRLPRTEAPRPPTPDIDGATLDARWHPHKGIWLHQVHDNRWLRILPTGRPPHADGITTGLIETITGQ